MTPEVSAAIDELRRHYVGVAVNVDAKGDGGAYVTLCSFDPGPAYEQRETWIGFEISYLYPAADVYPLFIRPDLKRVDGKPHRERITSAKFRGEPALQLSRNTPGLNPAVDTAALKVTKVLKWLRDD